MIVEMIQLLIAIFSKPPLYAMVAWFAVVGSIVRSALVLFLTRTRESAIVSVSCKLHLASIMISYVVAPVCTAMIVTIEQYLGYASLFLSADLYLYVWFSLIMSIALRHFLCRTFIAVACGTWQIHLILVDTFVAAMGYIFLRSMNLL